MAHKMHLHIIKHELDQGSKEDQGVQRRDQGRLIPQ